jgi:hypothetical protein
MGDDLLDRARDLAAFIRRYQSWSAKPGTADMIDMLVARIEELSQQVAGERFMKKWAQAERDDLLARLAAAEQRAVTADEWHVLQPGPSWSTKTLCSCGAQFTSRCEFWKHQADAYLRLHDDAVARRPPDTTP